MMHGSSLPLGPVGHRVVLRDYQETAVADIRAMMRQHRRVVFVLPTGGGKTVIFTYFTEQVVGRGKRVFIVAHRKEIVRQISKALARLGVAHGLIMPDAKPTDDPVQVCMIQTLANRLDQLEPPDLLVEDECHHVVSGSYQKIRAHWPRAFALGCTATPERLDGRGLGDAYDAMVVGPSAADLIRMGSLAHYVYLSPPTRLDLSKVHTRAGDYAIDELEAALEASTIVGDAVKHYQRYLGGKPAIAFCISVAHAKSVAQRFRAAGIPAASVDGNMPAEERDAVLRGLEDGSILVVTSCDLISEGFDVPSVQGALLLRPTKSLSLHLQQVGRCLRPKPDGTPAIILDHVGNCLRHGMPDWAREWSLEGRPKSKEAAPVSVCKLCFRTLPTIVARSPAFKCGGRDGSICPFKEVRETVARSIEEVDGELAHTASSDPTRPVWTQGISMITATGREWFQLLELAGSDLAKLKQIAKARHYKRGWAEHKQEEFLALSREVQDLRSRVIQPSEASTGALWKVIRDPTTPFPLRSKCRDIATTRRKQKAA
jgi:DNA repair protein RadD